MHVERQNDITAMLKAQAHTLNLFVGDAVSMMDDEQIEKLIDAIQKRPALYNKNLSDYRNAHIKKNLWEQICLEVIPDWSELEAKEKPEG
nr:unnamed protein product [Callosobruchus analis]